MTCLLRESPAQALQSEPRRRIARELLGLSNHFGGIAQLVEHLHGMQGVRGSNPLTSTENQFSATTVSAIPSSSLGTRSPLVVRVAKSLGQSVSPASCHHRESSFVSPSQPNCRRSPWTKRSSSLAATDSHSRTLLSP